MKRCSRCQQYKPWADFYGAGRGKRSRDGLQSACKECTRIRGKERRAKADPELVNRYHRGWAVGLRSWEVAKLEKAYDYRCAICKRVGNHLDHDHTTGAVRGLLCGDCNRGIGLFHDDPECLRVAADYLERNVDHRREGRLF
jgi:hypothetical protein